MKYYSAMKRNKLPKPSTAWMNLRGIILREARPQNYILYGSIYVNVYSRKGKIIETKNRSAIAGPQGSFGGCLMELLCFLIVIVTICFVKTHKSIHSKG